MKNEESVFVSLLPLIGTQILNPDNEIIYGYNDKFTWNKVVCLLLPLIKNNLTQLDILDADVICDEECNTIESIDRNELRFKIGVMLPGMSGFIYRMFMIKPSKDINNLAPTLELELQTEGVVVTGNRTLPLNNPNFTHNP
jgi:hypothetical protein